MRIVNTFISETNDIPEYTKTSLEQARRNNPETPIDFIAAKPADYFNDLDINWINQKDVEGVLLKRFRSVSWFDRHGTPNTTHPSPDSFWAKTAERLFYLEEYIWQNQYTDVVHIENDVMLYGDIMELNSAIPVTGITTSPFQTTFALAYISDPQYYRNVCSSLIEFMRYGEQKLLGFGYDHISEMSLLNLAWHQGVIGTFNIFPEENNDWVFDPASYGQFLGGTNNNHARGFTDSKHYIGQKIRSGKFEVSFDSDGPKVWDKENNVHKKIFNLHIHSKNLKDFVA